MIQTGNGSCNWYCHWNSLPVTFLSLYSHPCSWHWLHLIHALRVHPSCTTLFSKMKRVYLKSNPAFMPDYFPTFTLPLNLHGYMSSIYHTGWWKTTVLAYPITVALQYWMHASPLKVRLLIYWVHTHGYIYRWPLMVSQQWQSDSNQFSLYNVAWSNYVAKTHYIN